jgi:undecaprenyl phosphate-alpha-L-ara4N flippase subunit ArnF
MTALIGYGLCFLATLVVIAGDYYIKLAVDRGHTLQSPIFLLGCSLYALSAIGWFLALRHISLAQTGVAFSIFSLLALCGMGVVFFEEKLETREMFGIALAVCAMLLMARVA